MSAFEQLTGTLTNLTQTSFSKARILASVGVSKAKEMTEITKMKLEIAAEEDSIRKAYQEIGKLYFAERSSAPEGPYAILCEKITASKNKIAYHEERIADIRCASDLSEEGFSADQFSPRSGKYQEDIVSEADLIPETDPNQVLIPEFAENDEACVTSFSHADLAKNEASLITAPKTPQEPSSSPESSAADESDASQAPSASSQNASQEDSSAASPSPQQNDSSADFRSYLQNESTDDFRAFLANSSTAEFRAFLNRETDARFNHTTGAGQAECSSDIPPEA